MPSKAALSALRTIRDQVNAQKPKIAQPIVQAPEIIIPGKIQSVREAMRRQGGAYGAKRVERAADEVKNLEQLFTEKGLMEAFGGDNAKALMTMNPADFERYAKPLQRTDSIGPKMAELAKQGEIDKNTTTTDDYIKYLLQLQGGFDDVPFLGIKKKEQGLPLVPSIDAHEGRHRSRAMADRGETSSLVRLLPRGEMREPFPRRSQEEFIEALKKELEMTDNMVMPEKIYVPDPDSPYDKAITRPALKLPDVYAGGGAVKGALAAVKKAVGKGRADEPTPRPSITPEQMQEEMRRQALANVPEQKMLQGFYRGFAGDGGAAPDVFVTPQKRVADYYAQKRAGQTGQEPHAEMVLADPFAGRAYGHSTPGTGKQEPLFTRARKMKESDVVDRTPLYQAGGLVKGGLKTLDNLVMKATKGRTAAKDVFASDFQTIPEKELMRMNSIEREQRVPMQSIVPTQPDVKTETALEYMMSNRVRDPGTKKMPEVVKWGDKYYIMDGHHRVAGQLALDKTDIPVQVIGEVPALKKADGGLVAAFKDGGSVAAFQDGGAATGFFPQMQPRRAVNSGAGERMTEEALKFFIPQDTTDLALMAFPFGKAGKAAAAGLLALTPAESEAGKLKTGVDLARRSFFGLRPSQDMAGRELVPVQKDLDRMQAELAKAEKAAPKVEQKTTTVTPSPTAPKIEQTVKSIAETPMSRRTVLKSAAGQAIQGALPASSFADLMKPATVAKQAVQAMAPAASATPFGMPGMIAAGLREGMREEDVTRMILDTYGRKGVTPQKAESAVSSIKDPSSVSFEEPVGAGRAMMELMGTEGSPLANRGALRYMRKVVPEKYDELRQTAKDVAEYGFEP